MAGEKVEDGRVGGQFDVGGPCGQRHRVARRHRMEHQRRKRELVDRVGLRLVASSQIGDVVAVGDVGFGHQHDGGVELLEAGAQQRHDRVGLGKVDRGSARVLPEERHRVESHHVGAGGDEAEHRVEHREQHVGIAVVEVDLVGTERGPHVERSSHVLDSRGRRTGSGPGHGGEVGAGLHHTEERLSLGYPREELTEPRSLRRHMVDDCVDHQAVVGAQPGQVVPVPVAGVDLRMVDHTEPAIARGGMEGEHVHAVDRRSECGHHAVQRPQGPIGSGELVGIRDEPRVALAPPFAPVRLVEAGVGRDQPVEPNRDLAGAFAIEAGQQRATRTQASTSVGSPSSVGSGSSGGSPPSMGSPSPVGSPSPLSVTPWSSSSSMRSCASAQA